VLHTVGADRVLLIHITRDCTLPSCVQRLLRAPWAVKTGVGIGGDATKLQADHGVHVSPVFDAASVWQKRLDRAGLCPGRPEGLRALSVRLLGVPTAEARQWKHKSTTLSNWAAVPLKPKQTRYAALDAWASAALAAVLGVERGEPVVRLEPAGGGRAGAAIGGGGIASGLGGSSQGGEKRAKKQQKKVLKKARSKSRKRDQGSRGYKQQNAGPAGAKRRRSEASNGRATGGGRADGERSSSAGGSRAQGGGKKRRHGS